MKLLNRKQQTYTVNGKSQVTKNIVRKSINLLNSKKVNKYHSTCKSSKYSLDNLKKMTEEQSKEKKPAKASNLVQPAKIAVNSSTKTPTNLLTRTKNAATSQLSTIKANLLNKFTSSNQPATPIANVKNRATALNSVTRSIKATSTINPVSSKTNVFSTPTASSTARKAAITKTPSTVHSFQTKDRINPIQNDSKRLVNSAAKPTYFNARTPSAKPISSNVGVRKNISRTVNCAKTAIRRSIRLLNSPPGTSLTPNPYRRNLFPGNVNHSGTKIPILKNNTDRDFSKTDAGPQRTVNMTRHRLDDPKPAKRKSLMERATRLSSGLSEDTCFILTPRLMRQLIDTVSKSRANRENVEEEDEEEEEIKIQSVKPTSLLKYLLKEKHYDATNEQKNSPTTSNSIQMATCSNSAVNQDKNEEMQIEESDKLPMENSETIPESMNETIETENKDARKSLSKVEVLVEAQSTESEAVQLKTISENGQETTPVRNQVENGLTSSEINNIHEEVLIEKESSNQQSLSNELKPTEDFVKENNEMMECENEIQVKEVTSSISISSPEKVLIQNEVAESLENTEKSNQETVVVEAMQIADQIIETESMPIIQKPTETEVVAIVEEKAETEAKSILEEHIEAMPVVEENVVDAAHTVATPVIEENVETEALIVTEKAIETFVEEKNETEVSPVVVEIVQTVPTEVAPNVEQKEETIQTEVVPNDVPIVEETIESEVIQIFEEKVEIEAMSVVEETVTAEAMPISYEESVQTEACTNVEQNVKSAETETKAEEKSETEVIPVVDEKILETNQEPASIQLQVNASICNEIETNQTENVVDDEKLNQQVASNEPISNTETEVVTQIFTDQTAATSEESSNETLSETNDLNVSEQQLDQSQQVTETVSETPQSDQRTEDEQQQVVEQINETSFCEVKNPEEISLVMSVETQSNLTLEESQIEKDTPKMNEVESSNGAENKPIDSVENSKETKKQIEEQVTAPESISAAVVETDNKKPVSKRKRKQPLDEINNAVVIEKVEIEVVEPTEVKETAVKKRKYTRKNKAETEEPEKMVVEETQPEPIAPEVIASEPVKPKRVYNKKRIATAAVDQEPAAKIQKENTEPEAPAGRVLTRAQRAKMNQKI